MVLKAFQFIFLKSDLLYNFRSHFKFEAFVYSWLIQNKTKALLYEKNTCFNNNSIVTRTHSDKDRYSQNI